MGNHLLDGGEESKNFENFQEYPSFDNGILDLEPVIPETVNSGIKDTGTMNPGIENPTSMNSGIINPGIENPTPINSGTMNPEFENPVIMSAETMDNGILDVGTMDGGSMNMETINPGIVNPTPINSGTMDSGNMNSEFENPVIMSAETMDNGFLDVGMMDVGMMDGGSMNTETINPGSMDSGIMQSRAINSETMNNKILPQQGFDPVTPDHSNNYEQALVSGTIDSRSFTHTEAEWQRIQEGEPTVNYVDSTDSWDNYREDKPRSFFRTLLAFFVSIIVAGVFVLINVMFYDIGYISTLQCLISMLPTIMMFCCYAIMTRKRDVIVVEGVLLIVLNEIIAYIMFHAVMVHNVQKIYPEITFMDAWKFVEIMKSIDEMKKHFYLHFAIIFGSASFVGISFGISAIRGVLFDQYNGRRRRY